jgi:flagellar motility protein MotE (MotC chaperone)
MAEAADLTPEAPEAPVQVEKGGAKKAKAPKAPPAAKKAAAPRAMPGEKPGKKPAQKGGSKQAAGAGRPKGGFPKILLVLAPIVALLLVAGLCLYLDLFAWRSSLVKSAVTTLASLDEDYRPYSEALAERESALNSRAAELDTREEEARQREEALATESGRLERRAAALDEREKTLNGRQISLTPLFRREISTEKLAELKNLGKIYSGMEAEAAAQALSLLNSNVEMAEVLFYMDKTAASALMAALKPELAAQITSEMLRE